MMNSLLRSAKKRNYLSLTGFENLSGRVFRISEFHPHVFVKIISIPAKPLLTFPRGGILPTAVSPQLGRVRGAFPALTDFHFYPKIQMIILF